MKIKVEQKAFYKKSLVQEGQIIDYEGDTIPSWATLADGEEIKSVNKTPQPLTEPDEVQNEAPGNPTELEKKTEGEGEGTEEDIKAELETIKDLAVENDIWLDIPENIPEAEQIKLFKDAFQEKGINLDL